MTSGKIDQPEGSVEKSFVFGFISTGAEIPSQLDIFHKF